MFCPKCGTQCEDGARFCQSCGNTIAGVQAEPVGNANVNPAPAAPAYNADVNPAPVAPVAPNPAAAPCAPAAPKQDSSVVLILGIVAMVINLGLGCLCGCLGMLPGIGCAIAGLVMGLKEKKTYVPGQKNQKTDIGVILCIVALVAAVIISIINFALGATLYSDMFY